MEFVLILRLDNKQFIINKTDEEISGNNGDFCRSYALAYGSLRSV